MTVADHGTLTSRDVPRRGERSIRDEAMERLLQEKEAEICAEREAALAEKKPGLIAAVQNAANAVKYDQELGDAQANVADRVALLESALGALRAIRSDDKAARLNFKRARNAAIREGVPADELPDVPAEVSKMSDVNGWPGCGEGAWTSSWGRG
jgi:hypothetical protein